MTDRAEEIMDLLTGICETLGHPLEIDRGYDVNADDGEGVPSDLPLLVLRTGEEESGEGARPESWDSKWVMKPSLEFYLKEIDPAKQRAELSRVFSEFRLKLKASPILRLLTRGTAPALLKQIDPVIQRRDLTVLTIQMTFAFDRN